jgi:hypothetical protein
VDAMLWAKDTVRRSHMDAEGSRLWLQLRHVRPRQAHGFVTLVPTGGNAMLLQLNCRVASSCYPRRPTF